MPTPTERLEERKKLAECRVCAWLSTLDEKARRDWVAAIGNRRFGAELVATEITAEAITSGYDGPTVGESSVSNHRLRGHR